MNLHEKPDTLAESEQKTFMLEKHSGMNTSDIIIDEIVEKVTGSRLIDKERIIAGETNEVYSVKIESGGEVMVRISHGEGGNFEKEAWALRECLKLGIVVPEVLLLERIKTDKEDIHICVETKLHGIGLNKVPNILALERGDKLKELLHKVGVVLSHVHKIRTNGFGKLDKEGNGMFTSVQELIKNDRHIRDKRILHALEERQSDVDTIREAYKILEQEAVTYPKILPCLIHNDLSPDHILIDNGEVSGMIDFESATGGDPILEFALWDYKHSNKYPLKFILDGYAKESTDIMVNNFERKLNFWKIYRALGSLRYCVKVNKKSGIDRSMRVVTEAVSYFK